MRKSINNLLINKNVLLLAPAFFGYEFSIIGKLKEMGADVFYQDDDPSTLLSTMIETCWHFNTNGSFLIRRFENYIYHRINIKKYDIVLIINGWALTSHLVKMIKNDLIKDNGKMILYYWDSINVLKDDEKRRELFDWIYTFDNIDYEKNKNTMGFLPLFYCDEYRVEDMNKKITSDLLTVGSYKYNRYFEIESIKKRNPYINIKTVLYAKRIVLLHKMFRKKYKDIDIKRFVYKPLERREIIELYKQSKAILDIPFMGQNGLTMRTFECLGMRKKIITTNKNIVNYDFYDPLYIYLLNTDNFTLPQKEWFESEAKVPEEIIEKYSIESWLINLLRLN